MNKLLNYALFSSLALTALTLNVQAADHPARLMRKPDINNGKVVFVYQEDLWTVNAKGGKATRLTVHDGMEMYPKFSPDGKWIAFTANYNGSYALFAIPSTGGQAKQLTYYPDYDAKVVGWSPDSQKVVYVSKMSSASWFYDRFYEVGINGTLPVVLPIPEGSFFNYSPDGKKIAYNNHPSNYWWWKRYKGSANQDVWLYDKDKKKFQQLTNYQGNDTWPMWGLNDTIYYVSDRNGTPNIFAQSIKDKKAQQLTKSTMDIKWPSMGSDRKTIVYESDGKLFKLDTTDPKPQEIVVYAPSDDHYDMVDYINPMRFLSGFDISPTGKRIVLSARGDIFTAPAQTGDIRNLTESSNARDRDPSWSPDGKYIAYVSDESGNDEIYLVHQLNGEKIKLTDDKKAKFYLKWSFDSKKILYNTHDNYLAILDIASKKTETIDKGKANRIYDYTWAVDNKWVAYQLIYKNGYSDIYVYSLDTKKSTKITQEPASYSEPVFTLDGKTLIFFSTAGSGWWISGEHGKKYGDAWSLFMPNTKKMLTVSLMPEKADPYEKPEDEEPILEESKDKKEVKTDEKNKKQAPEADKKKEELKVEINFKNISDRIRSLPIEKGAYYNIQVANKYYYYMKTNYDEYIQNKDSYDSMSPSPYSLYSYDVEKQKSEEVMHGVKSYTVSVKGDKLLAWDGRSFQIFSAGGKPSGKDSVNLSRLVMKIDRKEEWKQIFNESWRMVRDNFYDSNMHGVDWNKIKDYYSSLLPYVRTRYDLNILLCEMVGELNASHQGVNGGDWPYQKYYPTGMLGAELIPDYKAGYYKFSKIYKGDKTNGEYISPLDNEYSKVKEGDYLISINGNTIKAEDNYFKYLVNQYGKKVTLTTNAKPSPEGAVETKIKPLTWDLGLRYKEWLDKNMDYVTKSSGSKIGYMHLTDMGDENYDTFNKYFQANRDKEAIIIDVRYNGGGSIDQLLIDKLERIPYMTEKSRYSESSILPASAFTGKVVVLINEYSFSDAEVFPRAFQIRKLGKVIGVPTLGYCIAVGEHMLIDGGHIRNTFLGLWDLDGNMVESKGVQPDIYVENTPESVMAGKDLQLRKAVDYLMGEIKKSPKKTDYPQITPAR